MTEAPHIDVPLEVGPDISIDEIGYNDHGKRLTFRLHIGDGGKMAFATQISETNIENIEKDWKPSAPVRLGDWVILQGNGNLIVVDETHFGDTYRPRSGPVDIQA